MNRRYSALALSAVAMGAVVLTTTEASAMGKDPEAASTSQSVPAPPEWPDEGTGYPASEGKSPEYNYPNYDPKYEVAPVQAATVGQSRSDDSGVEALQAGASALGGAAVAFTGMWLYRRRHALAG
ncbi:hypothetical protein EV644_10550 [Kribbella orskensis]|uniref:MYXO-CTERM domain-containing protein n=1 Tax=Kribbella orskensis TaxID=2512216 RepID=A0ABY2BL08_9ACTN|nr:MULTISPECIES: hypothetical protein [Kribbella]TCN40768.1 hypothetical protein EV642_10450 [Kribbella sp. VKM Ac-2500]TCO24020.1 hypothetical protein EV644_10550 [Kribbella orskensis]